MRNFKINLRNKGIGYLSIPEFDKTDIVKTAFTTRIGGVSQGSYSSLNLGKNTSDAPFNIEKNLEKVMTALSISKIVSLNQVHSDKIITIKKEDLSIDEMQIITGEGDAMVTNQREIGIMTVHADCVPIYFLDTQNGAIGLAHSGWKGTLKNIGGKTFNTMEKLYNSESRSTLVAIGPGIGLCCFETGKEVYERFKEQYSDIDEYSKAMDNNKYFIDLKGLIKKQLEKIGFKDIIISKDCTVCCPDLFYSHRRDRGITGRMAAILCLI